MTDGRQTSPQAPFHIYSLMIQGKVWRMTTVIGLSSRVHEDAPDPGTLLLQGVTCGSLGG